nr:hypothetical protein [Tanacetum cinerariifolium]
MRPFGCPVTILNTLDPLGKARVEIVLDKDYILLPLWTQDLLFSSSSKDSLGAGYKPSGEEEKKDAEGPGNIDSEGRNDQDEGISFVQEDAESQGRYDCDIEVNTASTLITTASINITNVEPVTTANAPITTVGVSVSTAEPSTPPPPTTTLIEDEDLIIS